MAISDKLLYTKESINAIGEALRHLDLSFDTNQELGEWARFIRSMTSIQKWITEYNIFGKTEQVVTSTGKNIVPNFNWELGHFNITTGLKENNPSRARYPDLIKVNIGKKYYFNTFNSDYCFVIRAYLDDKTFSSSKGGIVNGTELEFLTTQYISVAIYNIRNFPELSTSGQDILNGIEDGTIKPFICLASEEDKSYESFIPNSPSPEFPSEMNALGQAEGLTIIPASNQLFDGNFIQGYFINDAGTTNTASNGVRSNLINAQGNVTISFDLLESLIINRLWIMEFDENKQGISRTSVGFYDTTVLAGKHTKTIQLNSSTRYIAISFYGTVVVNGILNPNITNIMLNLGNTALPWEEYRAEQRIQKGKLIVRTRGKNLFNMDYVNPNIGKIEGNSVTYGSWANTFVTHENLMKMLKPNTTYTISYEFEMLERSETITEYRTPLTLYGTGYSVYLGSTNTNLQNGEIRKNTKTFTTPNDLITPNVRLYSYSTYPSPHSKMRIFNIQLEEGTEILSYEPFIEPVIIPIETEEPPRSLPNGVRDNLDYKKVGEIQLSSIEKWNHVAVRTNTIRFRYDISDMKNIGNTSGLNLRSNRFKPNIIYNYDFEGIHQIYNQLFISINKTHLIPFGYIEGMTTEEITAIFKEYLSVNPIIVQYELANPIPQNIDRPELPYFGVAPELLNEIQGEIEWTLDGVTHSTVIENE